jgi:NAD(P)-dependent dehydrogenase (short-subunit alcohol dehydrogenase family)
MPGSPRNGRTETVVITGASAGVGRATAREFARSGARIGLLARGPERLEAARREVEELGGRALAIPTDVADAEQVEREFGPIDIWVNNAMTTVFAPFHEITAAEYRRATEVTYLGTVHGTMAALKRMRPRDRGTIVQVGSALAYRAIPLQSPYCGAKHAIRGFTDSIRCELMHDGSHVHITMVQMPALNTPQFDWCRNKLPHESQPVPPIYQPEVAARGIAFAARNRRREVNVGLSSVITIWGNKLLPGLGDRYLARTGYKSQQTSEPLDRNRPDNLYQPVRGDYSAHGRFDNRSQNYDIQLLQTRHHGAVLAGTLLLAGMLGGYLAAR